MGFTYEFMEEWFDARRNKANNRRTLYSNHRFVYKIDEAYHANLHNFMTEAIVNNSNRWSAFNITTEEHTFKYKDVQYTVPVGTQLANYVYRNQLPLAHEDRTKIFDYLSDTVPTLRENLKNNIDGLLEFYPLGSYALIQFPRGGMKEPTMTFHPDGTRTFSAWSWGPRAQWTKNTIGIYSRKRGVSFYTESDAYDNNGIMLIAKNNKAYVVTADNPYVNVKASRCYKCKNAGVVVKYCEIGSLNAYRSANAPDERFAKWIEDRNIQVSHYKLVNNHKVYYCAHNQRDNHDDWTNIQVCDYCDGDAKNRHIEVANGLEWSGVPFIMGDNGKILKKYNQLDLIQSTPIRNRVRGQWSDYILGVEPK